MEEEKIGAILLTRAQDGMTLYRATGRTQIGAAAREVYDVSGAGDTAIAAFAVCLHGGGTFDEAAAFANRAAGVAVAHFGTYVVSRADMERA
jgi:D-beta-D-heptose 7-phosphate kinase/D-beta-D-heptose 1-phosphate adenosyltransferase